MVQRWWSFTVGVSGECDESHQIAESTFELIAAHHKFADNVLDRRQTINVFAVDLEIHCLHAAAAIDHHFDGDAFGVSHRLFSSFARLRKANDLAKTEPIVSAPGSHAIRWRSVGVSCFARSTELNRTADLRRGANSRHATNGSSSKVRNTMVRKTSADLRKLSILHRPSAVC
jgi:hypothetical protein